MKDLNDGISPQMTSKEYQKVTNGYVGVILQSKVTVYYYIRRLLY